MSHESGGILDSLFTTDAVAAATSDRAWLTAMLDAEAALARACAAAGLVPPEHAAVITSVCADAASLLDPVALGREGRLGANPVVPLAAALRKLVPAPVAGSVHHGATSQDILDTAMMLVARRSLALCVDGLREAVGGAVEIAERHRDTLQAARTLMQPALPCTFGLRAAGWASALMDSAERLQALGHGLPVQLGGAAGTLASLGSAGGDVRRRFAEELGLALGPIPWHADRQVVAELGAALAMACGACGKVGRDVIVLSMAEVAEVTEPAAAGRGGSSTLPHKRNPVLSTILAANARRAPALASVLLGGLDGELDRAPGAWHAEWLTVTELLRAAGGSAGIAAELLTGLEVDASAAERRVEASGGLLTAEHVRSVLEARVGRAEAEAIVKRAVEAAAGGARFADAVATGAAGIDLTAALDPRSYLGSSGDFVDAVVARFRSSRAGR